MQSVWKGRHKRSHKRSHWSKTSRGSCHPLQPLRQNFQSQNWFKDPQITPSYKQLIYVLIPRTFVMKFSGPEMLWGITTDINAIKKLSAHDLVKDNTKLKCISIKKFNKHFLWFAGYLQEDYERIWFLFWLLLRNFSWRGFNGVIGWKNWRLQKGKSPSCLPLETLGDHRHPWRPLATMAENGQNGQNDHFQAWSPRVANGRQGFPRSKGDPRDGWDELEPNRSYLSHFTTWYSKSGHFPIEIPIKNENWPLTPSYGSIILKIVLWAHFTNSHAVLRGSSDILKNPYFGTG